MIKLIFYINFRTVSKGLVLTYQNLCTVHAKYVQ